MEHVKEFLETSTIHGLSWISGTRRWSRLLWILIVIGGFSVAGYLIIGSFDNWEQNPITTTIETLPISKLSFPNVTVCPPKNSFLNLNYDIKQSENVKLDNNTRNELLEFALDVIQDEFYKEMMKNLTKVEDPDKYYNWYHGYTQIKYPYYEKLYKQFFYDVDNYAASGNISTKYFGEKFQANKVDCFIYVKINVYIPQNVRGDKNTTIMFKIIKETMKEVNRNDNMRFAGRTIDADLTHWSKDITAPSKSSYYILLSRKVSADDMRYMDLDMMPGFRLTWNYNKQLKPEAKYSSWEKTKQFVRYNGQKR